MTVKYTGSGNVTAYGIGNAAEQARLDPRGFRAVMMVETNGKPFDAHGRLSMLFEPHVFYKELNQADEHDALEKAIEQGLAYQHWGEKPYPRDSYPRFEEACKLNEELACRSASWGLGQILGENFNNAGYASAKEMVEHMAADPNAQAMAVAMFIFNHKLVEALNAHDWATFAHGYNGAHYRANAYDTKLEAAYAGLPAEPRVVHNGEVSLAAVPEASRAVDTVRRSTLKDRLTGGQQQRATLPAPEPRIDPAPVVEDQLKRPAPIPSAAATHEDIRWAQQRLKDLGYFEVGLVDGKMGKRTAGAILAFRNENDLPLDPNVDDSLKLALISAAPRGVSPERAATTTKQLRPESPILQAANMTKILSVGTAGVGAIVSLASSIGPNITAAQTQLEPIKALFGDVPAWLYGVAVVVLGVMIWLQARAVEDARTKQFTTGRAS